MTTRQPCDSTKGSIKKKKFTQFISKKGLEIFSWKWL